MLFLFCCLFRSAGVDNFGSINQKSNFAFNTKVGGDKEKDVNWGWKKPGKVRDRKFIT